MNEIEKMKAGMWYDANYNEELLKLRRKAMSLVSKLNQLDGADFEGQSAYIRELLGYEPENFALVLPFICDYGFNIHLGEYVFINSNCYLMDGAPITIGAHTFIGPFCGFYTAAHPLQYKYRNKGLEKAQPITVGENCWFGANVSVMPGVTIGSGCVIAAGSVVTKDIPDNSLTAGVPARVIRTIDQEERLDGLEESE